MTIYFERGAKELLKVLSEICEEAPVAQPMRKSGANVYQDEDYGYTSAQFEIAEKIRPFLKDIVDKI